MLAILSEGRSGYKQRKENYVWLFLKKLLSASTYLKSFHILHMYPKEIAYPNGYYDSRFAEVIGFNCDLMEKRNLGKRDGVDFWMADKNVEIMMIRIFADGSTMIKFFLSIL